MFSGGRTGYPYGPEGDAGGWWTTSPTDWSEGEDSDGRAEWTPEMRASYRSRFGSLAPPELCLAPRFYERVTEALERAADARRPLAVVVLQVHEPPAELPRQQALEMALRLDVREGDAAARLDETTFAVLLPDTDSKAIVVAARLQRALSNITGGQVTTGVACYPEDAATASELLEIASGHR